MYVLSFSNRIIIPFIFKQHIIIFIINSANKMSIVSGDKVFYYMTRESLCFLTMTEAKYPKRMGFLYLDEVCDIVLQELVRDHGNNVSV